jgi:MinD-like ATPase involved in chromosome partitioning or flagellar assembly
MLVTVVGPGGRRDLSLPADAPVRELLGPLVDLAGNAGADAQPEKWTLSPAAGQPLPPESSLAENGVLDGTVLYLAPMLPDGRAPTVAPVPGATDALTPIQRTKAALPPRHSLGRRMAGAVRALFDRDISATRAGPAPPTLRARDQPLGREDPAKPTAAALTATVPLPQLERAARAWHRSDYLDQLCASIAEPRLRRCVTIAVVSPKGGVGKTTITALLGTLLSLLRRDRIVAVDTNPDFGSLGRVLAPESNVFVDDLLPRLDQPDLTLTELDAQLGRAAHGLMVLPAPTDPDRMAKLDEAAYTKVIQRLKSFVGVVLLDCGTGLQEPAARAAIKASDQLVLVTDDHPAAASLVAEAGTLLTRAGHPMTLIVNKMPPRGGLIDLDLLARYMPEARGLVLVPRENEAATRLATGDFDWSSNPVGWQEAIAELAVVLMADWPRLGLTF